MAAPASVEPFAWPGGPVGCLLVHGYTGTPYELRYLGERLHAAGHAVRAVRLPGHGETVAALHDADRRAWLDAVDAEHAQLAAEVETVVAVGLSLGALLVLELAARRPDTVHGVVLLAAAVRVRQQWAAELIHAARPLLERLPAAWRAVPKLAGHSDIADPETRRENPAYPAMPFAGIAELVALQREVVPRLPAVHQPALIVHGAGDHTTPVSNASWLAGRLPNARPPIILPESFHVVSLDRERERVAAEVLGFIAHHWSPGAEGGHG